MARPPTVRSLAQQIGVSQTTISLALRDDPRVTAATKARVRKAAENAGYRLNPAVQSVMSALRRSRQASFRGSLLAVNYSPEEAPRMLQYHQEILSGGVARARELGYSLEHTWVGPGTMSLKRLQSVLLARSVKGLIVMPFAGLQDFSELDWNGLAAVVMDYCLSQPVLHTVLPDHHSSLLQAMEQLRHAGYRRPGLVLDAERDARLKHKWSAGFASAFREPHHKPPVPMLIAAPITRSRFLAWFHAHRPDVIVGHLQREITEWLSSVSVRIPQDVGFLHLNWTERSGPCAAVDQQPSLLGAAAVETVIAQITRNEHGIPSNANTLTISGRWTPGPTLKN